MELEKLIKLYGLNENSRKDIEYPIEIIKNAYEHSRVIRETENETKILRVLERRLLKKLREFENEIH